jgi:hypothetical protein
MTCTISRLLTGILVASLALVLGCGNQDEPITFEPLDPYGSDASDRGLNTSDITDGLVAYWPFSGSAIDETGNGHDGIIHGASLAQDRCDRPNSAYRFDGVDDFIEIPSSASLNFGAGDFTLCCWVFLDQFPVLDVRVVGKFARYPTGPIHDDNYGYALVVWSDGTARAGVGEGGTGAGVSSLVPLETGTWYFLTAVRSSGEIRLYVDAELQGSAANSRNGDNEASLEIGACKTDIADARWFPGSIDEVRLYNRALTREEIEVLADIRCETEVLIDIKPGSYPNCINPRSQGVIAVAILTASVDAGDALDFDATTVDPLSVEFGPDGATEAHGQGHIEDVDSDGDLDLLLHFRTQETGIECGSNEARLTGETYDGKAIVGSDSIQTVGCGG